jgi:tetrahydromethanopterin S-methyltransferase subunit C
MTVEKFIRILGYIVYVALWSPVIALILLVGPIVWTVTFMRSGMTFKETMQLLWTSLKSGIRHDREFIRTGVW